MSILSRTKSFLIEGKQELAHVQWPSRDQAVRLTSFVIGISIMLAIFLAIFDYLFSFLLQVIIR